MYGIGMRVPEGLHACTKIMSCQGGQERTPKQMNSAEAPQEPVQAPRERTPELSGQVLPLSTNLQAYKFTRLQVYKLSTSQSG